MAEPEHQSLEERVGALNEAGVRETRDWLRQQLLGDGAPGAYLDMPHLLVLDIYGDLSERARSNLAQSIIDILAAHTVGDPSLLWRECIQLLNPVVLNSHLRDEAITLLLLRLAGINDSKSAERTQLLQGLLSLGYLATSRFWHRQAKRGASPFAILEGLAGQKSCDDICDYLATAAPSAKTDEAILAVLPIAAAKFGMDQLLRSTARSYSRLPRRTRSSVEYYFASEGKVLREWMPLYPEFWAESLSETTGQDPERSFCFALEALAKAIRLEDARVALARAVERLVVERVIRGMSPDFLRRALAITTLTDDAGTWILLCDAVLSMSNNPTIDGSLARRLEGSIGLRILITPGSARFSKLVHDRFRQLILRTIDQPSPREEHIRLLATFYRDDLPTAIESFGEQPLAKWEALDRAMCDVMGPVQWMEIVTGVYESTIERDEREVASVIQRVYPNIHERSRRVSPANSLLTRNDAVRKQGPALVNSWLREKPVEGPRR